MPKGFVTESANPATHWLAKTLVDQGATETLVALTPKGFVAKSANPAQCLRQLTGTRRTHPCTVDAPFGDS